MDSVINFKYMLECADYFDESVNKEATEKYKKLKNESKALIKEIRKEINAGNYKEASKLIKDVNDMADDCIADLQNLKNTDDDAIKSFICGMIRNWLHYWCISLISLLGGPIGIAIGNIHNLIQEINNIIEAVQDFEDDENINTYIYRLIRSIVKIKVTMNKLSKKVAAAESKAKKDSDVSESVRSENRKLLKLFVEGHIDADTLLDNL